MTKQLLGILLILSACSDGEQKTEENATTSDSTRQETIVVTQPQTTEDMDVDSVTLTRLIWIDSLMDLYVHNTRDELIKISIKEGSHFAWMYDRMFGTDSTFYVVLHLGHNMEDHFATTGWLYIDTFTRSIYEYDLPNDSIYLWKAN